MLARASATAVHQHGLVCLPHWEPSPLERPNGRFEGFGKRQDLLVGLLLQVNGPAKALTDIVPCLVVYLADIVFRIKEVDAHRNAMRDRAENPRVFGLEAMIQSPQVVQAWHNKGHLP